MTNEIVLLGAFLFTIAPILGITLLGLKRQTEALRNERRAYLQTLRLAQGKRARPIKTYRR